MEFGEEKKLLNPTVVKLGLISFFSDVASEMLYPITPIFLTTVLGASKINVGLIEGVAEAVASLLKTYSGMWSDRLGQRKPFIVLSYLFSALAKPAIGVARVWPQVLAARALDRTGSGLRGGPRDAMLADAVDPKLRGAAFGLHRAMDTLGAAIGPLFAIFYLSYLSSNLRSIFLWAAVPGVIAAIIALSLKESKPKGERPAVQRWSWKATPLSFRHYMLAWGIFSIGNSSDVFLLLKARDTGLSLNTTILAYCLYNLIYALLSFPLGGLSDRIGRKSLLISGFAVFAVVYCGFGYATEIWQFSVLFAIYGIYMAATDGVGKALAIDLVPSQRKATAIGLLGTVNGITTLIASTLAGGLWDRFGTTLPFLFGAFTAVLAAFCLLFVRPPGSRSSFS